MKVKETEQQEKKSQKPNGIIVDDKVLVKDQGEASQIYNKGFYGTPQSGGALILESVEAIYLAEKERLCISSDKCNLSLEDIFRWGAQVEKNFEIRYLVYREMRQRGYVVKRGNDCVEFRVFPRGGKPGSSASKYWINSVSERWPFRIEELQELHQKASNVQKTLVIGVADEEGDVTYYALSNRTMVSSIKQHEPIENPITAFLMEDRAMVLDSHGIEHLTREGYGKLTGGTLLLSRIEVAYLMEKSRLSVTDAKTGESVDEKTIKDMGRKNQDAFDLRLHAYIDLRDRGMIPKTGFKYGSHFRVYDQTPENSHARFLIHVIPKDEILTWPDMSRAVRLAHGVRKELIIASPVDIDTDHDSGTNYLRIRRITP